MQQLEEYLSVGDRVRWPGRVPGVSQEKSGTIVRVIPPYADIEDCISNLPHHGISSQIKFKRGTLPQPFARFIVAVYKTLPSGKAAYRPDFYCPEPHLLKLEPGERTVAWELLDGGAWLTVESMDPDAVQPKSRWESAGVLEDDPRPVLYAISDRWIELALLSKDTSEVYSAPDPGLRRVIYP